MNATAELQITETTVDTDRAWRYSNGDTFYDLTVMFGITPAGEQLGVLIGSYGVEFEDRWVTYTETGMGTLSMDELSGIDWVSRGKARKVDAQIRRAYR